MTHAFLASEINDREMKVSKVHRTCHSINGGSLEITHVLNLGIITSYNKKYFKISLLHLTKKVSLKKLYSTLPSE